ncbi:MULTISPECIES: thioredoxin family protein [Aequorivita]|uniref:Thioredoxin family protein n=1 Tax=Aequorivita iocasae TaxID=2803865 RepID=A0ABX7DTL5_9FLAO|nr:MULTISPECIES: thioredoxin family protein [Aequorivita]QQX76966.1 thioredoxin family protein [Aequorivita iocasae]UCA56445.1 thioredoxin family protein [Aequorivita sp. F7]
MKKLFIILSATLLVACNSSKEKNKVDENTSKEMISENNKEKINDTVPYEDSVMLLGKANRKGFQMDAFKDWFNAGYEGYNVDSETVEKLKPLLKDVEITVFMGTWCEDSQRETPHFYKILDEANFDESKLTLITVSDEKTTPQGFEDGKNITNVPTLIFYKNDKELGRIVEYPIESLEKDMLAILSGKDYKHAYAE